MKLHFVKDTDDTDRLRTKNKVGFIIKIQINIKQTFIDNK